MNAKQFIDLYGKEKAEQVAARAGTSYAYFTQLASGNRRPSVNLAERLVKAREHELDFVSLLKSKSEAA